LVTTADGSKSSDAHHQAFPVAIPENQGVHVITAFDAVVITHHGISFEDVRKPKLANRLACLLQQQILRSAVANFWLPAGFQHVSNTAPCRLA
jgi:hypothetical protein